MLTILQDVNAFLRDAQCGTKRWKPAGYRETKITVDVQMLFRATFGGNALPTASDKELKELTVHIPTSLLPDPSYQMPVRVSNVACNGAVMKHPDHVLNPSSSTSSSRARPAPAPARPSAKGRPLRPSVGSLSTSRSQLRSSRAAKLSTSHPSSSAPSLDLVPAPEPSTSHALSPPPPPPSRRMYTLSPSSSPTPPPSSSRPSCNFSKDSSFSLRPAAVERQGPLSQARSSMSGAASSPSRHAPRRPLITTNTQVIDLTREEDDEECMDLDLSCNADIIDLTVG